MISKLFWVLLTAVFTFLFMVLFENGTINFAENCRTEFTQIRAYFSDPPHKKADAGDRL